MSCLLAHLVFSVFTFKAPVLLQEARPDSIFKFVTDSYSSCAYLNSQGDNYASLNDKQQKVQIPCPTTVSKLHYHFLK